MSAHPHRHHHHHHDHRKAPGDRDWADFGAQLELEAEVLSPYLDEAMSVLESLASAGALDVRRVVDLGSGPGAAATALARAFPAASVLALDRAPALLERARERAARLGVGDRVTTSPVDLEASLGALGPIDLAWTAMVLHHLPDPARLLRELRELLTPGGLVAIVEFGPPTRTLPDDLGFGAPGFGARHAAAVAAAIEDHLPPGALHTDWPETLRAAGLEPIEQRILRVDRPAPLPEPSRRWIAQGLQRSAEMVAGRLSEADRETLAVLADPDDPRGALRRSDTEVHAARSFYVARKPVRATGP
ncbi:MAG: class I SAM-dependent methyltransferase [Byssovorax sp.]